MYETVSNDRSQNPCLFYRAAGNCEAFSVTAGVEASAISLTSGTVCEDALENLDALTITLLAVAGSVVTAGTLKSVIKLKKFLKGLLGIPGGKPKNPLIMVKVVKAGIKALKMVKELNFKKLFIVGKLVRSVNTLPIKVGILAILSVKAGPALKVGKLSLFLSSAAAGLLASGNSGEAGIINTILGVLGAGDNDSLTMGVITAIMNSLLLGGETASNEAVI